MRRCLIILIVFCTLFSKVNGQSPSAAIDSLIKYRVITIKERPALEREFKYIRQYSKVNYRIAILGGLKDIVIKKTFHTDPHKTGFFYSYSYNNFDKRKQDSINISLRLLLQKVKKAGLLNDRVYTYTLKDIDSNRYFAELQLIGSLTEMSSRLEWLSPDKLLPVAEELHKNDILSYTSYLRLKDDINNGKIESSFQLNEYCRHDKVIDVAKYPENPDIWLEQIHRDISSILPGLDFTDFNYTELHDTSFSIPGVKFKVSLTCNGHTYKHTSITFNNYRNKGGHISPEDILVEDFYRIFNKILTDQQSPYRLHNIMFSHTANHGDTGRFALIALKDKQVDVFMRKPSMYYMLVSMDSYEGTLTSAKIDSTIAGWKQIGLFSHLSDAEVSKGVDNVQAADPFFTGDLLSNFPGVVYNLHDALIGTRRPYGNLLTQLSQITHGAFKPTKIIQTKVNHGLKLQYLFKGKIHSFTFPTTYGWNDVKFAAFMKDLGRENKLPGNFYQLSYEETVIYLTKQQYSHAIEDKLLSFGPNR